MTVTETDYENDPTKARHKWCEAVLEGSLGTAGFLQSYLPPIILADLNSTAASGTDVPVTISGEIP